MMQLAWVTDLHLDLVGAEAIDELNQTLVQTAADAFLIGGDMGQVETFREHLITLSEAVDRPCYFVLGNHDHYGHSIGEARRRAAALSRTQGRLHWLPAAGIVRLSDTTVLMGHGCWGDGRAGSAQRSKTELADFALVSDLNGLDRGQLFTKLNALGDEVAAWVGDRLESACAQAEQVLFLVHVPPFAEPATCPGRASDPDALPFYTCVAAGDSILEVMSKHPETQLTILSGHTHTACELRPAPNIRMITGGAQYFQPRLQLVLKV